MSRRNPLADGEIRRVAIESSDAGDLLELAEAAAGLHRSDLARVLHSLCMHARVRPDSLHPDADRRPYPSGGMRPTTTEDYQAYEDRRKGRMTALCRTMPYLRDRAGFGAGWDTKIAFAGEPNKAWEYPMPDWAHSSAAVEAVRFARHVWNHDHPPPRLGYWDAQHVAGFAAWAARPWWM